MIKNVNREKTSPHFASKKGARPTWGTYENSKRNWRKCFHPGKYKAKDFDKAHVRSDGLVQMKYHSKPKGKFPWKENK